jgi:hypothetical protein
MRSLAGATIQASELLKYEFKETELLEARITRQARAMEEIRSRT